MVETAVSISPQSVEAHLSQITPFEHERKPERPLIPRIEDYPTKARIWVTDAHAKAVPLFQKCERYAGAVITFVGALEKIAGEGQAQVAEAGKPTNQATRQAAERLAKVAAEFAILQRIHQKLSTTKDASRLLLTPSPLTGEDYLTKAGRAEFATRKGFLASLTERVPFLRPAGSISQKQVSNMRQASAYGQRVAAFVREAFGPLKQHVSLKEFETRTIDGLVGRSESQVIQAAQCVSKQFWDSAVTCSTNLTQADIYKDKLYQWLGKEKAQIEKIGLEWNIENAKKEHSTALAAAHTNLENGIKYSRSHFFDQTLQGAVEALKPTMEALGKSYQPYKPGDASSFMTHTWVPCEATEQAATANKSLAALQTLNAEYSLQAKYGLEFLIKGSTGKIESHRAYASQENEGFVLNQDLFWHVAPYEKMKLILARGILASRKAQIDRYGESYFNSGGAIKTTKDQVIITDKEGRERKVSHADFKTNSGLGQAKAPKQEMYQACFSVGGPYHYQDGVALVFSKASLCAKSQFFDQDGWHLFSPDYRDSEDSPGFEVDLNTEPNMLVVVTDQRSSDFINFLKNNLGKTDEWIAQNVITVPAKEGGKIGVDAETIRQIFFERHDITIQKGIFVPTGEAADHAGWGKDFLYTYKAVI
ncbi:MAG: hypothetical protein HYW33_00675 [Candidatus Blackburnbacteria bacterium]|nr:hypothetical protein [Candidatus Blackburnbacteria bacterium]